ncbi:hypothetical protein GN956_G25268 [Arapaima gigas]
MSRAAEVLEAVDLQEDASPWEQRRGAVAQSEAPTPQKQHKTKMVFAELLESDGLYFTTRTFLSFKLPLRPQAFSHKSILPIFSGQP